MCPLRGTEWEISEDTTPMPSVGSQTPSSLVLCSRLSRFFVECGSHERSSTSEENLCDFERTAAVVSFGVALSEIDLGSGFLVPPCGHPVGELGRTACARS